MQGKKSMQKGTAHLLVDFRFSATFVRYTISEYAFEVTQKRHIYTNTV